MGYKNVYRYVHSCHTIEMKPLDQSNELQHYYQDRDVVARYLKQRTAQPLNGLLHKAQVQFLNSVVGERSPKRVLEIAPGPARLTSRRRPLTLRK